MQAWAATELRSVDLGDPRREQRMVQVLEALAEQPQASVPQACGSWAATKAAYRLLANPAVNPAAIRAAHVTATVARVCAHRSWWCSTTPPAWTLPASRHPGSGAVGTSGR